jgi:hypothetical protein
MRRHFGGCQSHDASFRLGFFLDLKQFQLTEKYQAGIRCLLAD